MIIPPPIAALRLDEAHDESIVNLCAFDNVMSRSAAAFLASPLAARYRIGTFRGAAPAPRSGLLLRGYERLDELEAAAHRAACELFGGVACDLRALSGVHATTTLLLAATVPGDTVYSIAPEHGGHFATRQIAERAGRVSRYLAWDVEHHNFDLAAIVDQFQRDPPAYILLDHGTPLAPLKLAALRAAAGPRALIDYDASHTLGLIAGGAFQDPLAEGCDILHGNTHKSFPGPQKALIVFKDAALAARVQAALDAGLVSSQHTHHLIALCVTLLEMRGYARAYAHQMLRNGTALERALRRRGFIAPDAAPTRSHVLLLDTPGEEEGWRWFNRLCQAHIATNVRPLFGRTLMRLGVQEVTRRGFTEADMETIAAAFEQAVRGTPAELARARTAMLRLRRARSEIRYSFDGERAAAPAAVTAVPALANLAEVAA